MPAHAQTLLKALDGNPEHSIRWNSKTNPPLGLDPVPWNKHGFYLRDRPVYAADPLWHAGAYYVQEASSMLLAEVIKQIKAQLTSHMHVLDLSAAPGGKTTLLDQELPIDALIIANEIIPKRAHILRENVLRWGSDRIRVTHNSPTEIGQLGENFQFILVDAPCSGEGMFRKDDMARTEWTPESGDLCSVRQTAILKDIWPALVPGGFLLYSTCTFDYKENLDAWRELNAHVVPLSFPNEWGIERIGNENQFGYQCYPDQVRGEGFFFTLLKKPGDLEDIPEKSALLHQKPEVDWLQQHIRTTAHGNKLFGSNMNLWQYLSPPLNRLNYVLRETPIAQKKGSEWRPETPLAWSKTIDCDFPEVELSRDQALEYLHGQDVRVEAHKPGYVVLTYRAVRLGFGKQVKGRINNGYQKSFRLRKSPNDLKHLPLPW